MPLTELSEDERVVTNAEIDVAISERLRTVNHGGVLAAGGVITVALADDGRLVRYHRDGTTGRQS